LKVGGPGDCARESSWQSAGTRTEIAAERTNLVNGAA
jgi:hypothetical protein